MEDFFVRIWNDVAGRIGGPMTLRLFLQPLMASFFAVRDGWKDAGAGCPAYFWRLLKEPDRRGELVRNGWKSVGKIVIAALVLDTVYQIIVLRTFYPGEATIVAGILAIVPYVLLRGPANRVICWWRQRRRPALKARRAA